MEFDGGLDEGGPEVEVTEWEEDRVSEWEVLTRHHSVSPPSTPLPLPVEATRSASAYMTSEETIPLSCMFFAFT